MKRRLLAIAISGLLLSGAGMASAAGTGPPILTDSQLDQVAAGLYISSWSGATASVLVGGTASYTQTSASNFGAVKTTSSTSAGAAIGLGARATATAGSVVR